MTNGEIEPAPGTDAQDTTEEADTKPSSQPEPDDSSIDVPDDRGETTGPAEG